MSVSIRDLMTDPALYGKQFGGDTWASWRALLAMFYGEPLEDGELDLLKRITGLSEIQQAECIELWLVMGRRGGKTFVAALVAIYEAAFVDHRDKLAPGERATVFGISPDRKQSRTFMRYVSGLLHANPMLEKMIVREDRESIELSNRSVIEVGTASFRSVRGYSLAAVVCDEIAFWRSDESANPDVEIINALRPAMATLSGKLICLSSPYSKRGELWNTYRRHYGEQGDILVAQADTRTMNPSLSESVIKRAYERDPAAAAAEYGAQFRTDIESFIDRSLLEALVRDGPAELAPDHRHTYSAFCDPAGGGADAFTLAIGHMDQGKVVVDVLRDRRGPPGSIVAEYAHLLHMYHLRAVTGDKYAGQWPAQEFARHDIHYHHADKSKSDLYIETLASINNRRVELPDSDRLLNQFSVLERKTSRAGKDSIDHPPGGHDDLANAVAGLVATMTQRKRGIDFRPRFEFAI